MHEKHSLTVPIKKPFIPTVFLLLVATSCKLFDSGVTIPSYLYIKPTQLQVNADLSQGAAGLDTTDVWVFANGKLIGAFATPALIPVLKTGDVVITTNHGIKQNGQDEERMIYPMLKEFTVTVNLKAERIDTIQPIVTYLNNATFPLIEDFDRAGLNFEYNPQFKRDGDTLEKITGSQAWLPNQFSGRVTLKNDSTILEIYSRVFNNFRKYTTTFLELDYRNNIPFVVGMYVTEPDGNVRQVPLFYFNEKAKWNKLYLNLENEIGAFMGNSAIRLFFRFSKNYNPQVINPEIWLDNIKLIYLD